MLGLVEPRVRRVVAETLGVGAEELAVEVSLVDDLAADSLDLVEIAVGLEAELGIAVPECVMEDVRTYGDLVETALGLAYTRHRAEAEAEVPAPSAWTRLVLPAARRAGELLRADRLTPYVLASIVDDARGVGEGARLEVRVESDTTDAGLERVRAGLAPLADRGITLSVEREPRRDARVARAANASRRGAGAVVRRA